MRFIHPFSTKTGNRGGFSHISLCFPSLRSRAALTTPVRTAAARQRSRLIFIIYSADDLVGNVRGRIEVDDPRDVQDKIVAIVNRKAFDCRHCLDQEFLNVSPDQ